MLKVPWKRNRNNRYTRVKRDSEFYFIDMLLSSCGWRGVVSNEWCLVWSGETACGFFNFHSFGSESDLEKFTMAAERRNSIDTASGAPKHQNANKKWRGAREWLENMFVRMFLIDSRCGFGIVIFIIIAFSISACVQLLFNSFINLFKLFRSNFARLYIQFSLVSPDYYSCRALTHGSQLQSID